MNSNLLQNHKALILGLHARIGLKQGGKGSRTLRDLVDVGRRLGHANFVMYAAALGDLLSTCMVPLALTAQSAAAGAATLHRSATDAMAHLDGHLAALQKILDWSYITAIVGPMYLSDADLRNLWLTLTLSPLGRAFPGTVGSMYEVLYHQRFRRTELTLDYQPDEMEAKKNMTRWLGPKCQCHLMRGPRGGPHLVDTWLNGRGCWIRPSRTSHASVGGPGTPVVPVSNGPRRPTWDCVGPRSRRDSDARQPVAHEVERPAIHVVRKQPTLIRVPEWVANCQLDRAQMVADVREGRGPREVDPRYVLRSTVWTPTLVAMIGEDLMAFARGCHHGSRCIVPAALPATFREVAEALRAAKAFGDCLRRELDKLLGSAGMNTSMRSQRQIAAFCFDWKSLLKFPLTRRHVAAFEELYQLQKPTLCKVPWPHGAGIPGEEFSWLAPRWPPGAGISVQYVNLIQQVRAATNNPLFEHWWQVQGYWVKPVYQDPILAASFGLLKPLRQSSRGSRNVILSLVGRFWPLSSRPRRRVPPFYVREGALAVVGRGAQLRLARGRRREYTFRGAVGCYATVAGAPFVKKLVLVVRVKRILLEDAVDGSVDEDPFFTHPNGSAPHCWHAVLVHLKARLTRAVESGCERWGSLIHTLWDSVAGWQPQRMVARLFIREAFPGGEGGPSEDVVHEIAQWMLWKGTHDPFDRGEPAAGAGCPEPPQAVENLTVRRGLRESTRTWAALAAEARPMSMPPAGEEAVRAAIRHPLLTLQTDPNPVRGAAVVRRLPAYVVGKRTAQKANRFVVTLLLLFFVCALTYCYDPTMGARAPLTGSGRVRQGGRARALAEVRRREGMVPGSQGALRCPTWGQGLR